MLPTNGIKEEVVNSLETNESENTTLKMYGLQRKQVKRGQ